MIQSRFVSGSNLVSPVGVFDVQLNNARANVVGIVAYTHFKLQEQRVERKIESPAMEELVVCNGTRTTTTSTGSLASSEGQE